MKQKSKYKVVKIAPAPSIAERVAVEVPDIALSIRLHDAENCALRALKLISDGSVAFAVANKVLDMAAFCGDASRFADDAKREEMARKLLKCLNACDGVLKKITDGTGYHGDMDPTTEGEVTARLMAASEVFQAMQKEVSDDYKNGNRTTANPVRREDPQPEQMNIGGQP